MIKLIASDLDGTLLLNGAQSLDPGIFDLIRQLKKMGILFVAASGRQVDNLMRLFGPVSNDIAYICENGCICFYQGKRIYKKTMDRSVAEEILTGILEKESAEVLLSGEHTSYIQPKDPEYLVHLRDVVKNNVTVTQDLFGIPEDYFKISIYEKEGISQEEQKYWQAKFGPLATVVTSGTEWLDTMPKGVHKGLAMEKLQEYFHIAPEECMAFGDNYNDVEMLQKVKYSVAMKQAPFHIREIARDTTDRVESVLIEVINGTYREESV